MRKAWFLTIIAILFSQACSASISDDATSDELLAELNSQIHESKVNVSVSKLNWLRSDFLVSNLSKEANVVLRDCALTYTMASAIFAEEMTVDQSAKLEHSLVAFAGAAGSYGGKSTFEDAAHSESDYIAVAELVKQKLLECEKIINPLHEEFSTMLEVTNKVKK